MKNRYIFDKDFNFKKVTNSVWGILWTSLKWIVATVSLAAFYYLVFSFFLNTEEEKKLKREIRMYEKLYPEMKEKEKLISDVIKELQLRDNDIYKNLFHADAPQMDMSGQVAFVFAADSVQDKDLVEYTRAKAEALSATASLIDSSFMSVFSALASRTASLPPMRVPVEGLKYAQVGASTGQKMNPFYKVSVQHNGVDLIIGQGTPVLAAGEGTVCGVTWSSKGLGNVVEIDHGGGYVTRYAHLEDIVVRRGERVKAGKKIANVGISGNSFAPHLHFEIRKDESIVDPVCYFFTFTPEEYTRAAFLSATTGQSMD